MVHQYPVRRNLTTCGTFWHAETDADVVASPFGGFLLHCARGIALVGLTEAFLGNLRESLPGLVPCSPPHTRVLTFILHRS